MWILRYTWANILNKMAAPYALYLVFAMSTGMDAAVVTNPENMEAKK